MSGAYPFYYVSLVEDKNTYTQPRLYTNYNLYARPTVFFDGGYKVNLGAGDTPSAQTAYTNSINSCGNRSVPDLDLTLSFTWLGNARMSIRVALQNNDTSDYSGYLRVYVTETISSLGWKDSGNKLYTFPFLAYAFNESVYVSAGTSWQDSVIWNGYQHSDGYGHYFTNITRGNITIIGAVFNSEGYQKYSDPPTNNYPFIAHYGDEATAVWIDLPPNIPNDSLPKDSAVAVSPYADLRWTGGDSNYFDIVTYDLYFGESNPPLFVASRSNTTYDPGILDFGTTYYWQIVAKDGHSDSTLSPVWRFTTIARGDCTADGKVSISDVLFLINYVLKSGPGPNPLEVGNANCDGEVTVGDVIYLINYLFRGGPPPC